ncbi:MAG: metallopeptidase family protein [Hyphomicrobiaceae bacterium]
MPAPLADDGAIAALEAPDLAAFERLADTAWRALPDHFRAACGDLVIHIEDFATDEVLDHLGIDDPYELTGLYHGVSLEQQSVSDPRPGAAHVTLYRRPILDEWASGGETLGRLVAHVLIHEIGHHFGFSDEDMARIEATSDGPGGGA